MGTELPDPARVVSWRTVTFHGLSDASRVGTKGSQRSRQRRVPGLALGTALAFPLPIFENKH